MHNTYLSMLTAVILGLALGYFLQRGRFCLNSAFRDIIFLDNLTTFRAYLVAVVVSLIGSNIMQDMGWLVTVNQHGQLASTLLLRQSFVPVANIVGGLIFGMGIVLAGGCASGIVYRSGEGQAAAFIAIFGFIFGILMTTSGVFSPLHDYLSTFTMSIGGHRAPAFWQIFGDTMTIKWICIAVFSVALLAFIFAGKPKFGLTKSGTFTWSTVGLLVGLTVIVGWWVSCYFGGGIPRGLAITTPIRELFNSVMYKSSHSFFPEMSFLGIFKGTWGVFFIIAVPFGSFFSAKARKEFAWKIPPVDQVITVFGGSLMMGIGAIIAGGCNLGHGITGVSTGAVSSIIAITAMAMGNWIMSYIKFIRPASMF